MEPSVAPSSPTPESGTLAGDVLRPALLLWLVTQVAFACNGQLVALLSLRDADERAYLVTYEVGYVVLCWVVWRFVRGDPDARRVFAPPRPRSVELCLTIGITTTLLLSAWERALPGAPGGSPIEYEHAMEWPLWAVLVASALLPALFEEWMYRGLLLQRFRRVLSPALAIAVQAMLFAGMHFDFAMLLPHFVFGAVAGILRVVAGGLWPCMLMHLLWNGYITLSVFEVV